MKNKVLLLVFKTVCCWLIAQQSFGQKNIEVFFFLSPDCPISQQYTPIIRSFYSLEYKAHDISAIKLIFPSANRKAFKQKVAEFLKKYQLNIPFEIDWNHDIARKLKAAVTPEVFVLNAGKISYHGAIDNMYAQLGVKRTETTEFYLENIINAIRENLPLPYTYKEALGCYIEY